jgi:hypothetical protein
MEGDSAVGPGGRAPPRPPPPPPPDAADAFTEAAGRTRNEAERTVLRRRADENRAHVSKFG